MKNAFLNKGEALPLSRGHLFQLMLDGKPVALFDSNGHPHGGLINSIGREDGSGLSFIVEMDNGTANEKFHIRTTH